MAQATVAPMVMGSMPYWLHRKLASHTAARSLMPQSAPKDQPASYSGPSPLEAKGPSLISTARPQPMEQPKQPLLRSRYLAARVSPEMSSARSNTEPSRPLFRGRPPEALTMFTRIWVP